VEGHFWRLEQVEDRILELKDKIEINKKEIEEILVKELKNYVRNIQELSNSINRTKLRIWTLKKKKRCKPKGYIYIQ
jgi:hypothetical protein